MCYTAYIGLGSNLGDRQANITAAAQALGQHPEILRLRISSLLETEPVGGPPGQEPFLNAAARLETTLDAENLLSELLRIEHDLGRVRRQRWGPRTIDLDLLLFDHEVIEKPHLQVPHPRMHHRQFVLAPLAEVGPEAVHPIFQKSVRDLLADLPE